ncbi:Protein of unknown function (DUF2927) [Thioclava sp. ES.031]|uniref:DUF2927 domain-containing protein n=1 Tax=Thioclava sp. ES.031 TaxID=1798203 RepID=UPI000BF849CB|nr:DUF2927 domain-containing protein [Thioclava sp. ES.031]PFG63150.1 Protein of unknown function (DUF2927) [Thioclava sp. ES.031]
MSGAASIALALSVALPAQARDTAADRNIANSGKMSDRDFYRAMACAARPGGACTLPYRRWAASKCRDLTVGLAFRSKHFPAKRAHAIEEAARAAIDQINKTGAALHLSYAGARPADINLYLTDTPVGGTVRGTPSHRLNGRRLGRGTVAKVTFYWQTNTGRITDADIAFSRDIQMRDIRSVVLEEIVQSLGFSTDLEDPYYTQNSIFSENGNSVTRLIGQDAMTLRSHYPPR